MPVFEYKCKKCSHVTSFLEKAGTKNTHICEKCGSRNTEKLFSAFAAKSGGGSGGTASCPTGTCPLS